MFACSMIADTIRYAILLLQYFYVDLYLTKAFFLGVH